MTIKVLIIYISRDMPILTSQMNSVLNNLVNTLINDGCHVDICCVTSSKCDLVHYKQFFPTFKYEFICSEPQFSKICSVFNYIKFDDYDWYIKIRPEIVLHSKINLEYINNLSKISINSRIRHYCGGNINIKNAVSLSNHQINHHRRNSALCRKNMNNEIIISIDDQMFFFHKTIAEKMFVPFNLNDLLEENKNSYNYVCIKNEINKQAEGFFTSITFLKHININIISLILNFRGMISGDLIIDNNTPTLDTENSINNFNQIKRDLSIPKEIIIYENNLKNKLIH
tara:strand:- start:581 stop:1435 length:855 start_codon:yes stop_codon:yes gene_type:complete